MDTIARRRMYIIGLLVLFVIVPLVTYGVFLLAGSRKITTPSYTSIINRVKPELFTKDAQPIFDIVSTKKLSDDWQLVVIKIKGYDSIRSKLLFHTTKDDPSNRELVLGPGTNYSEADGLRYTIPKEIIVEFNT